MKKIKLFTALTIGVLGMMTVLTATPTYAMENSVDEGFLTEDIYNENIYFSKLSSNITNDKINTNFKIREYYEAGEYEGTEFINSAFSHGGIPYLINGSYYNVESFTSRINKYRASHYVPWTALGVKDKNGNGYLDTTDIETNILSNLYSFGINYNNEESFLFVFPTTYYKLNSYDKTALYNELNSNPEMLKKVNDTRDLVQKIKNALEPNAKFSNTPYKEVVVEGKTYTISGKANEYVNLYSEAETITPENIHSFDAIYEGTSNNLGNRIYQFLEVNAQNNKADTTYFDEYNISYNENYNIEFYNGNELVNATLYPVPEQVYTEHELRVLETMNYESYDNWYKKFSINAQKIQKESISDWDLIDKTTDDNSNNNSWDYEELQRMLWEKEVLGAERMGYIFNDTNKYYELRKQGYSAKDARDLTATFSYNKAINNTYDEMMNNKAWYEEQAKKMGEENVFDTLEEMANNMGDWLQSLFHSATNGKYES